MDTLHDSWDHCEWRLYMTQRIAESIQPDRFGVYGMYLIGSVKNCTAGPASDIDLLVHFRGTASQRKKLECWLEGWGRCLAEVNRLRTGEMCETLLDVHVITDDDIINQTSFATHIGAATDGARKLILKTEQAG